MPKKHSAPKSERKPRNIVLAVGLILVAGLGVVFGLRVFGFPFPYIFRQTEPAPEGVAITISLLAFCSDNSTEVVAIREFKLTGSSGLQLVTQSGKVIKYFAVTALFLVGPPEGEQLQAVDLGYEIALNSVKTETTLSIDKVSKTISLPVIMGLAVHQSTVVSVTPAQLGLANIGDASLLKVNVKVQADMTTDLGRKVMSSSGVADARLTMQEGGFTASSVSGTVTEKGHGYVVAVLTGTWSKPQWRVIGVVPIAGDKGLQYLKGESGNPTPKVDDEPPPEPTPKPTEPTSPTPTPPPTETPGKGEYREGGSESELESSHLPLIGLAPPPKSFRLSFLDGYRIMLPWRVVPGFTLDGVFVIALFIAVGMMVLGLITRKK